MAGRLVKLAAERHMRWLKDGNGKGYWFDEEKADRVITFFTFLKHHKGEQFAGSPFELAPWQCFVVGSLFGWKRADGKRVFRNGWVEVARKNGKALALDTPIPTPDGWSTMGQLSPGDWVFDQQGMPCRVVAVTEVMEGRPCYRLTFSDGSSIVADAEHEWWTQAKRAGNGTRGKRREFADDIRTTAQIAETVRYGARRDANHSIMVAGALAGVPRDLPVAPYVLGAWLGDGHSASALITTIDDEVLRAIEAAGVPTRAYPGRISYGLGDGDKRQTARDHSVQARLRRLGVLNNKHIPPTYQRASIAQRMDLLRGLMDTDGYISKAGQCEFVTVSERLWVDVLELLRGLGFKPTSKVDRARIDGRDCGPRYRVQFWAYDDRPVFALSRKAQRQKAAPTQAQRSTTRQIVDCEPVESVPVRCIQVDSPSRLYLAGESMIPTHNSTLAAGLANYLAFFDGEPGAEVYCAAVKRDQAKIVWDEAKWQMENASAALKEGLDIRVANMHHRGTYSKSEPLGSDRDSTDGLNPYGEIRDELHAWKDRDFLEKLDGAMGSRVQPLVVDITTAGAVDSLIYMEKHEYAVQVVEEQVPDDTVFVYIATLDTDDAWDDPKNWIKANPNLGVSKSMEYMEERYLKAKSMLSERNPFLRYQLNVITNQTDAYLSMDMWDAQDKQRQIAQLYGQRCYAGIDLSEKHDLTALELWFPDADGNGGDLLSWFWMPEDALERRIRDDRVPYDAWARQGLIELTPGEVVDYEYLLRKMMELRDEFDVRAVWMDPYKGRQLGIKLKGEDFEVEEVHQGFTGMNPCITEMTRVLENNGLRHGGHPILRWMAGNVSVRVSPDMYVKFDKSDERRRIDGMVAAALAIGAGATEEPEVESGAFWA